MRFINAAAKIRKIPILQFTTPANFVSLKLPRVARSPEISKTTISFVPMEAIAGMMLTWAACAQADIMDYRVSILQEQTQRKRIINWNAI
mmetsp:Transcript_2258/g.3116  ORF Transcript_2258/g.3116 Transcript_2258/m.3116 type:complete len:90 (-) Transcript_2258:568-837(-)